MEEDVRKCHLCDGPTKDKYCINETCAEFLRDEPNDWEKECEELIYSVTSKIVENNLLKKWADAKEANKKQIKRVTDFIKGLL